MNTAAAADPDAMRIQTGYLGAQSRRLHVHVHAPAEPASAIGVVIVPPFGYEAVCAERSLRAFADAAAQAGHLAVRIDPDGCGQSAGSDLDPDRLEAWLASIDETCNALRAGRIDRLVLFGVRLGATLALLAGARRTDVDAVVALAAITRGKAWLRECRLLQNALALAPPPAGVAASGHDEIVGFALGAGTREALAGIDLIAQPPRAARHVLLIEREELPLPEAWPQALAAAGVQVRTLQLPGYAGMLLDPHNAVVPTAMIAAGIGFIDELCNAYAGPGRSAALGIARHMDIDVHGTRVREEAIHIDARLAGILASADATNGKGLILLNAGAIGAMGPNRLHVELARRLAAEGFEVLRLDLSGIGDSRPMPEAQDTIVYSRHALADVAAAVDFMRARGVRHLAVGGLCSGGYHALRSALAGTRIDQLLVINPLTFHYHEGMSLDFTPAQVADDVRRYKGSVRSAGAWKKLFSGQVDVLRLLKVLGHRAHGVLRALLRNGLRRVHWPLHEDLGSELLQLARRGVRVDFLFASTDPGPALLREQGGYVVERLRKQGQLDITIIEAADHTFTPGWSHPLVLEALMRAMRR